MKDSHVDLMKAMEAEFGPVLAHSPDGVYLWLDDGHMICNAKMAALFGYTIEEMCAQQSFLESFVAEEDQHAFSENYHTHIAALASPVRFTFHGIRKGGSTFLAETDMIPISFRGHAVAYHFVRKAKGK